MSRTLLLLLLFWAPSANAWSLSLAAGTGGTLVSYDTDSANNVTYRSGGGKVAAAFVGFPLSKIFEVETGLAYQWRVFYFSHSGVSSQQSYAMQMARVPLLLRAWALAWVNVALGFDFGVAVSALKVGGERTSFSAAGVSRGDIAFAFVIGLFGPPRWNAGLFCDLRAASGLTGVIATPVGAGDVKTFTGEFLLGLRFGEPPQDRVVF